MDRRKFMRGLGITGAAATLLPVSKILGNSIKLSDKTLSLTNKTVKAPKEPYYNAFDSNEMDRLVRREFEKACKSPEYPFLHRTNIIDAEEDEITSFLPYTKVFTSDIIADDDSSCVVNQHGNYYQIGVLPNIKLGIKVSDYTLNSVLASNLAKGLAERTNSIIGSCWANTYSSYERLGIKVEQSDITHKSAKYFKTSKRSWLNMPNTPLLDIKNFHESLNNQFDTIFISTPALKILLHGLVGNYESSNWNTERKKSYTENVLSIYGIKHVEIYDGNFWEKRSDKTKIRTRVIPSNKIIFANSAYFNDSNKSDFGMAQVTESIVSDLAGVNAFGPVSYFTTPVQTEITDKKDSNIHVWSVMRGWPRRHVVDLTGCLTIWPDTDEDNIA